jgi:hypothetical protein
MRRHRGRETAIAAGAAAGGVVHGVLARHTGGVVALDQRVVGGARGAAGEGVSMAIVGGPASGYAAAHVGHGLGAGVGVV